MPGIQELIVILLIVFVLFGARLATRLPQVGRGLGEAISNFKRGLKSDDSGKTVPEASEKEP